MSKAKPVRLGGLLVLAAALAVLAVLSSGHLQAGITEAGSTGTMTVDCDADTAGVQANCSYALGATFNIQIVATPGAGGAFGWQAKTAWVDGVVNYVPAPNPATEASWLDTSTNPPTNLCGVPARTVNPDASVLFGCVPFPLPVSGITTTGTLTFEFNCKSDFSGVSPPPGLNPNQSSLNLVPRTNPDDAQLGSHFLDANLAPIDPTLTGATVTCEAQPTPTNTPIGGPTPTNTPPIVCGADGCTQFDSGDATIAVGEDTQLTFLVTGLDKTTPVQGVSCTFSVVSGDGTVSPTTDTSDADGLVTTTLTAGDTVGTVQVKADCGTHGSSTLDVSVAPAGVPVTGLGDASDNGLSTTIWSIAGALLVAAVAGLSFFGWRYARSDRKV